MRVQQRGLRRRSRVPEESDQISRTLQTCAFSELCGRKQGANKNFRFAIELRFATDSQLSPLDILLHNSTFCTSCRNSKKSSWFGRDLVAHGSSGLEPLRRRAQTNRPAPPSTTESECCQQIVSSTLLRLPCLVCEPKYHKFYFLKNSI